MNGSDIHKSKNKPPVVHSSSIKSKFDNETSHINQISTSKVSSWEMDLVKGLSPITSPKPQRNTVTAGDMAKKFDMLHQSGSLRKK